MTRDNPQTWIDSEESTEQETGSAEDGDADAADRRPRGSESLPADVRTAVLERDGYRCQVCGRCGPEQGGLATLHVHHIERGPDSVDEDAPANLTTLCRSCHNWVHQQSTRDDAPVTLSEADLSVLLPQDIEILRYLADEGPARTGEIADALTADLSVTAVRERLAVLMGLDNQVESRDRQIVDQGVETGVWGLTEQIEHSARGHIPSDPQALVQRVEDEQVRRALERGCDRQEVIDVLDVSRRTTFHKEKRAKAYDFPLAAFRRGGDGGQHPAGDAATQDTAEVTASPGDGEDQQRLDTVIDTPGNDDQDDSEEREASAQRSRDDVGDTTTVDADDVVIREQLQTAITALQQINADL
ncbi:HNH endonuclease [Halobellus marinus]|uniref:HNH endonuclease n=1 Tax=Halobellus TaxID=1073986 RepID=UPI0028A8FF57|nr:HNH endonuclease [Halobellus sp. DFY28]